MAVAAAEHNPNPFRLVGAEYIQIWTAVSLIDLEPTSEQLGGYARSYHEPFRVVGGMAKPVTVLRTGPPGRIFMHRRSCRERTHLTL